MIDRNPLKFVQSIYRATASGLIPATQRISCTASTEHWDDGTFERPPSVYAPSRVQ
jgi:hypothetical protein